MKKFQTILVFSAMIAAAVLATESVRATTDAAQVPKVIVVKYHADWCASCKELDEQLPDLRKALNGEPVLFLKLDLTDADTSRQAEMLMTTLGLREDWKNMGGGTGLVNVIDTKSKKRVAQLDVTQSAEEMTEIIREFIQ